jgi:hypothetical protein
MSAHFHGGGAAMRPGAATGMSRPATPDRPPNGLRPSNFVIGRPKRRRATRDTRIDTPADLRLDHKAAEDTAVPRR